MNLLDQARQVADDLMAQREAWVIAQAEARGVTVRQLAETHDLEIGPSHLERDEEIGAVSARRDVAMAGFDAEAQQISADRAAVTPSVADALLSLYSKIREAGGGIGAAELRQRRCGGCRLELNQLDLSSIRAAADSVAAATSVLARGTSRASSLRLGWRVRMSIVCIMACQC